MTTTAMDTEQKELPAGWKWVKLGDVCEIARGGSPRPIDAYLTDSVDGVNWVKISDATASDKYIYETQEKIIEEGVSRSRLVHSGDFLLSNSMSFGRPYIMRTAGCIHDGWLVLRQYESAFDQDFLYHLLGSSHIYSQFEKLSSGSTVKNLNIQIVSGVRVAVPPLHEQKRISAILNEQMDTVEKAKKAAEERLEAAKALPAAYLRDVFEGCIPMSIEKRLPPPPSNWRWEILTDLASLESGHTPSRKHPEYWKNGDIPWLALPDIREVDGEYCKTTSRYTNTVGIANSSARVLPANTVSLCRDASVGLATIFEVPMATSQHFFNWVCGENINPEFLLMCLLESRSYIRNLSSGSTIKTVYKPTGQAFQIALPSYLEQSRLASEFKNKKSKAKSLEESIQQELDTIEAMPASLLRKAFSGEL